MRHLWQEYVGRDLRIIHIREKVDTRRGGGVPEEELVERGHIQGCRKAPRGCGGS